MEYNEEQIKGMIEKLKYLEYLYKELEQQLRKKYSNFVQTGETMSPELFKMMIYIADYYNDFIGPKKGSSPKESKLFFTSSIGLKIWDIFIKVQLLIVKSVIQEWFTISTYLETHPKIEYIPGELEDDRIYFNRLFSKCLCNNAFAPTMSSFIPHTRESLISSIYFLIYSLKDNSLTNSQFFIYMNKEIVREYPIIKERYLNAKIVEDKYQMIYEQDKEFTFLEKKYNEHEYDWFEDLETNLPLNLNSLIKLVEAYLYFPQDMNRFNELLEESLKIDPNNFYFYTLRIKSDSSIPQYKDNQHTIELALRTKEFCERGLEILKKAKPLPLREEIKLEEGEILPERKNDLKLFSFYFEMAYSNLILFETPDTLAGDTKYLYLNQALEEFQLVELFTRYPLDGYYYFAKGNVLYYLNMFEQAIRCYQYVDKYSCKLPKNAVIDAIVNSCNCLVAMGYASMCLEELDKYIEQYEGDIRLRLEKIYVEEVMCKSKAELAIIKEKYTNLAKELSDSNFEVNNETGIYTQRWLDYVKSRIVELERVISDPMVAKAW
ncbi:hypothetical protein ABK040_003523 [Willaertia magna]